MSTKRKKRVPLFVAVVANIPEVLGETHGIVHSRRPKYMDWSATIGTDRKAVIDRAIELSREWEFKGFGPYEILVGQLIEKAALPTAFKIVKV